MRVGAPLSSPDDSAGRATRENNRGRVNRVQNASTVVLAASSTGPSGGRVENASTL